MNVGEKAVTVRPVFLDSDSVDFLCEEGRKKDGDSGVVVVGCDWSDADWGRW